MSARQKRLSGEDETQRCILLEVCDAILAVCPGGHISVATHELPIMKRILSGVLTGEYVPRHVSGRREHCR